MVRLRRTRYLSCFYCGRRSSIAYNDAIREFTCANCDATNYLDENGEITDPPLSSTSALESTGPFFASGPESFRSSPSNADQGSPGGETAVFCKTCLKNQHLFISSLAQYFPSDPDDPDTAELDRRYFRFRQGLEQRYPQVCADCEPRVLDRIREARYTAKTDHLRRMVDYSRQVRLTRATPIDAANWAGQKLWWAGLVLQILWQTGVIGSFLRRTMIAPAVDAEDLGFDSDVVVDSGATASPIHTPAPTFTTHLLAVCGRHVLHSVISKTDVLRSLCIAATLASSWWNPFLVQTARGFTKPLIGISTWYTHQLVILLVRVVLAKVAGSPSMADESTDFAAASLPPTVAGAHTVAALLTLYLYTVAPRVIRKDLRPLFSKVPETSVTPQEASKSAERQRKLSESQRHDLGSISDVLDEIASEPPQRHVQSSLQEYRVNNSDGRDRWQSSHIGSSGSRTNRLEIGTNSDRAEAAGRPWLAGIASSSMSSHGGYASTAPASQPRQTWSQQQDDYTSADADEMDWTPTQPSLQPEMQSPHRAFNTFQTDRSHIGQRPASANAFAQTSVATNPGPFWYKVPPTPTNVAQNILKRQNVPWFAQEDSRNNGGNDSLQAASFFSPKGDANSRRTLNFDAQSLAGASSSVEFAPPSFFAEDLQTKAKKKENGQNTQRADDPGSLSDLFSQTFSLDAGDGRDEDDDAHHGSSAASQRLRQAKAALNIQHKHQHRMPLSTTIISSVPSLLWHVATFAIPLVSLGTVRLLREGTHQDTTTAATTIINQFQDLQPYTRLIEALALALCTAKAIVLTGESIHRLRRSSTHLSRAAATGLLLGLASIALAGLLALQTWPVLQIESRPWVENGLLERVWRAMHLEQTAASSGIGGWLDNGGSTVQHQTGLISPWPWRAMVTLQGMILAHQTWNMFVQ